MSTRLNNHTGSEIVVGTFMLIGMISVGYLAVSIGGVELFRRGQYAVDARFESVGELRPLAAVKIAGVKIGRVSDINLEGYFANVRLEIRDDVELPLDTIASIRVSGLLGEAYVSLSPGADENNLRDGGRIPQTEPAIDLIDLVSRYVFDQQDSASEPLGEPGQSELELP